MIIPGNTVYSQPLRQCRCHILGCKNYATETPDRLLDNDYCTWCTVRLCDVHVHPGRSPVAKFKE